MIQSEDLVQLPSAVAAIGSLPRLIRCYESSVIPL